MAEVTDKTSEEIKAWIDNDERTTTIDYRPVHEYTLSNEVAYIPPKERVY